MFLAGFDRKSGHHQPPGDRLRYIRTDIDPRVRGEGYQARMPAAIVKDATDREIKEPGQALDRQRLESPGLQVRDTDRSPGAQRRQPSRDSEENSAGGPLVHREDAKGGGVLPPRQNARPRPDEKK